MSMKTAVILSAVRAPIGKFMGGLGSFKATELGAKVVKESVSRAGIESAQVSEIGEVIMGNVLGAGLGQNPARQAGLWGGLANEVAAMTVNKVCGSGLKAVALAAQSIQTDNADVVVAGGMESMTNAPFLLQKARAGLRLGHSDLIDSMIWDGLWDIYNDFHMGQTGELVAEKYSISREEQDQFAFESHQKAITAAKSGHFESQILSIEVPQRKGDPIVISQDESPREDTSVEKLAKLRPAFKKDGTVTAGNAPGVNDGAAALVVASEDWASKNGRQPIARIVGQAVSGIEPKWVMMAPVSAFGKLLEKVGWKKDDVELVELNEAFSVQALAVIRELGLDPARVNVNGGAVALGHPIGASGARILVTLLHEMIRRDLHKGVAALCLGGGNAVALAVER